MNRSIPAITLCLLLAACKGGSQPDAATPAATPPAPAAGTSAPAPQPKADANKAVYQFAFATKTEEDTKDPRVVDWGQDGCGPYPIAKVDSIPLNDAWLQPDHVVEFDAKGQELTRWGKPMGAELIGLDGAKLQFRVDDKFQKGAFATDASGAITPIQSRAASLYDTAKPVDCPKLPTFAGSDYLQCYLVKDAANTERRLAWEGPCT